MSGQLAGHGEHPTTGTYLQVAAILTVVTAIEFGALYVPVLKPALAPLLLTLSAGKFLLVVGFFMHLKPDPKLFRFIFALPLLLAIAVMLGLMLVTGWFTVPATHVG